MKRIGAISMGSTGLKLTVKRGASTLAILVLAACGGGEQLKQAEKEDVYDDSFQISTLSNLLQSAPDEFSVVTKRPLELPGSFDTLPVPEPGKRSTRDPNPQADARAALLTQPTSPVASSTGTPIAPSASEAAFLSSIAPADPAIRQTLAAEQSEFDSEQNLYVLDRIFPRLREARGDLDPEQLDGNAERLRLLESGVTGPRPDGIAPVPAVPTIPVATAPAVPAPLPTTAPVAQPASPTFGVLAPGATPAPELIYIPE